MITTTTNVSDTETLFCYWGESTDDEDERDSFGYFLLDHSTDPWTNSGYVWFDKSESDRVKARDVVAELRDLVLQTKWFNLWLKYPTSRRLARTSNA